MVNDMVKPIQPKDFYDLLDSSRSNKSTVLNHNKLVGG